MFCQDMISLGTFIESTSLSPETESSLSSISAEELALRSHSCRFWVTVSQVILIRYNSIQFHQFGLLPRETEAPEHLQKHMGAWITSRLHFATSKAQPHPQIIHTERPEPKSPLPWNTMEGFISSGLLHGCVVATLLVIGQKNLYCSQGTTNIRHSEPVWKKVIIVAADTWLGTERQRHLVPGSLSSRPANRRESRGNRLSLELQNLESEKDRSNIWVFECNKTEW